MEGNENAPNNVQCSLFQIEDDAFEGLRNLEYLDISDNKILALPAAALARLQILKRLKVI